jgi:mRNA interferase MazF
MQRGDLVTVAASGDYGKPRPALVIQTDHVPEADSIIVCLVTSTLQPSRYFRFPLPANEQTGLSQPSQVMVDKITTVRRDRCGRRIGTVDAASMLALNRLLAFMIGIAG